MSDGQFSPEWAESLQPGDRVMVDVGRLEPQWQMRTVARTTKLTVLTAGSTRFKKKTGMSSSSYEFYGPLQIVPVTRKRLENYRWNNMSAGIFTDDTCSHEYPLALFENPEAGVKCWKCPSCGATYLEGKLPAGSLYRSGVWSSPYNVPTGEETRAYPRRGRSPKGAAPLPARVPLSVLEKETLTTELERTRWMLRRIKDVLRIEQGGHTDPSDLKNALDAVEGLYRDVGELQPPYEEYER